jgi:predicted hydrolase (HD superfamily)
MQDLAIAETPLSTGFRVHKQLRALIQAHALYRGDKKVKMQDFEEIKRLSKFMNLDFHQI